jgi:hypothetical protein
MMRSDDALPAAPLGGDGPLTRRFRELGVGDFRAAARWVRDLPYGRITDRSDPTRVLDEERGTCTTKHALLAILASEMAIDVVLTLGIYAMCEANTPGVGRVLERHGLAAIPEAHCYLTHRGERIDVTRDVVAAEPIGALLHEEPITPAQIGDYKIALHRRVLGDWAARAPEARGRSLDEMWTIREACITALSDQEISR